MCARAAPRRPAPLRDASRRALTISSRREALRAARGTLAEAGGEGGSVRGAGALFRGLAAFSFAAAGVRLSVASASALRNEVAAVNDWAASL